MTLAALEATLRSYDQGREGQIPVLAMLSATPEALHRKAERLLEQLSAAGISARVLPVEGYVGGGSVPGQSLKSYAVALEGDPLRLEQRLRLGKRPIVGRIHDGCYLLDVRTLWEEDFAEIADAVREAMA